MKSFRKSLQEDVYSLYSMNIPAELSDDELEPYMTKLINVIIIESRDQNLIVKVKKNDEVSNAS